MNDLQRGYSAQRAEVRAAAERVLESGWYVHGGEHDAFESELAAFLGTGSCIGVASGTDALELAIRALAPQPSAVIVMAANAGMYASTAARRAGARVRYADVDRTTMNLDWATVAPVLDDSVAAVVVTHLYGRMAGIETIAAECGRRGIRVIEDCAQAIGAAGPGGRAGSIGDVAAFSFYPTKNLGALGDGGALATSQPEIAERLGRLRQYGWSAKYVVEGDGGRNSRLDEIQAAFLRVRLPHVDAWNRRRRAIISRYADAASGTAITVAPASDPAHAGHLAVALAERRDEVRDALSAHGVQTDVHYPVADHRQPAFAHDYRDVRLPNTDWLQSRIFSLPCFPELTDAEIDQVCDGIGAV
jgi:dTDP-4-amino-4,6-dideoxygalactose transaminase